MYTWSNSDSSEPRLLRFSTIIIFGTASASALIMAMLLHTYFNEFMVENPVVNYILLGHAFGNGLLYGLKISEKALQPSETRSALKRKIIKTFLFFLVIGGLFSSVNFALHGGALMPETSPIDDGLLIWVQDMLTSNGGTTFLIASSFTLMAAATRRIVGLNAGMLNRIITFAGTFIFFSMISMSLTQSDPTHSQVYLYTFYHAGIIGGAMYQMNRFTTNLNKWEDYMNKQ